MPILKMITSKYGIITIITLCASIYVGYLYMSKQTAIEEKKVVVAELEKTIGEKRVVQNKLEESQQSVKDYIELNNAKNKLITELANKYNILNEKQNISDTEIAKLKEENDEVKKYLSTRIPDAYYQRLLDRTKNTD